MARIVYADHGSPEVSGLVDQIIAERGELLHLYQMLLHSPPVAQGWLDLMTAVRQQTTVPGRLRELVIIRIAHLNGAAYEAEQHRLIALREGAGEDQITALTDWEKSQELYDRNERAALELTDQMTCEVKVSPDCWGEIRELWTEREIVELVTIIASYNMVSRVLVALEIDAADDRRDVSTHSGKN